MKTWRQFAYFESIFYDEDKGDMSRRFVSI